MRFLANAKTNPRGDFPAYPQVFEDRHGFIPNLSVLDLLFNEGPSARDYLQALELPEGV